MSEVLALNLSPDPPLEAWRNVWMILSRSCCLYWLVSRSWETVKGGAWGGLGGVSSSAGVPGPAEALGLARALEDPSLFDPRGSLWSPLSDLLDKGGPVGTLEAWPLCAGQLYPLTEVIFSKRAGWSVGYGDFRIVKGGSVYKKWR